MAVINKQRKLKKELKERYFFERKFSNATIQQMMEHLEKGTSVVEVAKLTVGAVRLDAVLYWNDGGYQLGYDLMVRDELDSPMWICYDSLTDAVNIQSRNLEREMFRILDQAVTHYGLSYTECDFPVLDGKPAGKP